MVNLVILLMFVFSTSVFAQQDKPEQVGGLPDDRLTYEDKSAETNVKWDPEKQSFVSEDEVNSQISYDDMLRNSRPISLFFEVRKSHGKLMLRDRPNASGNIVKSLSPGDIIQVVVGVDKLVERNRSLRELKGYWHAVSVLGGEEVYFFETLESVKAMRLSNNSMPIELRKPTNEKFESYFLHQVRLEKEGGGISLKYQVRDPRKKQFAQGLWLDGRLFKRLINHHYVNQFDCIPISWFTDDIKFTKYLASEFGMLPKSGKRIKDKLSDTVFMQSKRKKMASLRRDWIKEQVTKLSDDPDGDVIVREKLDLSLDLGGKIAYETIDFSSESTIADISYTSTNTVAGIAGYVPVFLDLELSFKVDLSYPVDQTFTDNIKQRDTEIDEIYHITADQLFIFQPDNTTKTGLYDHLFGIGATYKGMLGREVAIGYDTLLGLNLTYIWSYGRLVGQFKFAPLGNQFSVSFENQDSELILGYLLYDNQYYRDFIFYIKGNYLTFTAEDEYQSELTMSRYSAGISLGF